MMKKEESIAEKNSISRRKVGSRIAQLLEYRHWTRKELSERSGVSTATIGNILNKPDYNWSFSSIEKIVHVFGLDMRHMYIPDKEWEKTLKDQYIIVYVEKTMELLKQMDKETFEEFIAYGENLINEKKKPRGKA